MNLEEFEKKYNNKITIDFLEKFARIQVKEDTSQGFYKELKKCIQVLDTDVVIANGIVGKATKEEFLEGEKIIQGVVEEINPHWTIKQKAAYVHYKIGELVSYVPDFNFRGRFVNSPISKDTRNIWKSVINGKSVCNGITDIARNILARVGVTTRELSSATHTFLLVETEEGNIITDPTWDLANTLYGARPMYFGKTYEQLREQEGPLSRAHKLESPPENVIEISEQELREIYHSLGFTKEDRTFFFPILDKVNEINNKSNANIDNKIRDFFTMVTKEFPKECTHLQETRSMIESCLYELGIKPKDLITKFIYDKKDEECQKTYLSLLINSEQKEKQLIYYLDTEKMQFKDLSLDEINNKYKTHNLDTTEPFWKKYLSKEEREKDKDELQK